MGTGMALELSGSKRVRAAYDDVLNLRVRFNNLVDQIATEGHAYLKDEAELRAHLKENAELRSRLKDNQAALRKACSNLIELCGKDFGVMDAGASIGR